MAVKTPIYKADRLVGICRTCTQPVNNGQEYVKDGKVIVHVHCQKGRRG